MAMPLAPLTLAGHVVITRKEKSYTIQTKKGNHTQCYKILIFFSVTMIHFSLHIYLDVDSRRFASVIARQKQKEKKKGNPPRHIYTRTFMSPLQPLK